MPSERRLHPLSVLFAVGTQARALLLPALLVLLAARRGRSWEAWLAVLLVPYTVAALYRYLTLRYEYGPDELIVRTGAVFRNERHVPYARIHNIASVQNPLHRLFRVAEVRVETAGGREAEAHLQVLSVAAMEEMRRLVRERKERAGTAAPAAGGVAALATQEGVAPSADAELETETLLRLPLREVVLYGLVNNRGLVIVAALWGLAWETGWIRSRILVSPERWERISRVVGAETFLGGAVLVVGGLLLFLVTLRVLSVGWAVLRLYDFRLERRGREVRTSCGLLTQIGTVVPLQRIQLISVRETLLHRLVRRAAVRVQVAGGKADERFSAGRELLAPILPRADVARLLAEVQPGIDFEAVEWRPVDARAGRRRLRAALVVSLTLTVPFVPVGGAWVALAFTLLAPLLALSAVRGAHAMGWALTPTAVLWREGWWTREVIIARLAKVQVAALGQSPFDRRWRMARVHADTAGAGAFGAAIQMRYLEEDVALEVHAALARRSAGPLEPGPAGELGPRPDGEPLDEAMAR